MVVIYHNWERKQNSIMIYSVFEEICIIGIAAAVPKQVIEIESLKTVEDSQMIDIYMRMNTTSNKNS